MLIASFCLCATLLTDLVAADVAKPVRPAGVDGQPAWNAHAMWFMYPPTFDIPKFAFDPKEVLLRVLDAKGALHTVKCAKEGAASLEGVWGEIPEGLFTVFFDSARTMHEPLGAKVYWKAAPFRPGAYPKAPRSYAEAAKKLYDYLFTLDTLRSFRETGNPDPKYKLNSYPSKMHAATAGVMMKYAELVPERREESLKLARACLDYLLARSQPADAPLAHFPPTYEGKEYTAAEYAGQNMLIYPSGVGGACLDFHRLTGERKYLDAALGIAATYAKLQGEDGTWYLKMNEKDGRPIGTNRLLPGGVIGFMQKLHKTTGDAKWRDIADRAFRYYEENPLKTWNWEGQFEDVPPTERYVNLSKHPPCAVAMMILERWPDDPKRRAQARELLRFSEDQFVCWERPFGAPRMPVFDTWDEWVTLPAVVEQYYYREPIDASSDKLINTYLKFYEVEGNPLDLAKARALGDALVRVQRENGRIQTVLSARGEDVGCDWVNCMIATAGTLQRLASFDGKGK